jgi:ABC-type multidrug transport system fused ATPase/permease subunit
LDEATAAMDRRTEQFVLQLLDKLKENMIIILVTHRIQVARRSDKIYIIENRQVTASGTHEELLSQNELYRVSFEAVTVS